MKNQQPYFIRPLNHLTHRNASQKESFSQQSDDRKSLSQNKQSQRNIVLMPPPTQVVSPNIKKIKDQLSILRARNIIDLPQLHSPFTKQNNSISKFKSQHNISNIKAPLTPRRFKSDEQDVSVFQGQTKKNTHNSHHNPNQSIHKRPNCLKPRLMSNHTPLLKMKTEPSEIQQSPIIFQPKHDDSREMLYQLQKKYETNKHRQTEPDDPYKFGSLLKDSFRVSMKKKTNSIINQKHFVEIPIYDEDSQYFDRVENPLKQTQKNPPQIISQSTKEKILDLLFLSTQELKSKFNEQSNIQQSKLTSRQVKIVLPKTGKSKFPTDFFNVLSNESQQCQYA